MAKPNKKAAGATPALYPDPSARGPIIPANVRVRTRTRPPAVEPPGEPEAEYEVGYKKPPVHSRFKKGKPGNPSGRPKGARNLKTEILAEISELITVRENGKARRIPKLRALVKRLFDKGLQGDMRAIQTAFNVLRTVLPEPEGNTEPNTPLAEEDLALLMEFAGRQRLNKEKL